MEVTDEKILMTFLTVVTMMGSSRTVFATPETISDGTITESGFNECVYDAYRNGLLNPLVKVILVLRASQSYHIL